ncbi:MAG: hypothetical protein ABTQ30_00975, partial [Rhizobiaceae bacterium]
MPSVPDEYVPFRAGRPLEVIPDLKQEFGIFDRETWAAAGTDVNSFYRSWRFAANRDDVVTDPDHNPFDMIKGTKYEADPARFAYSRNADETRAIISEWDEDEQAKDVLARSGWAGVVASVGMGMLDPTVLIPVGGVAAGLGRGARAALLARNVALSAGAGAAISETAMAVTTPDYTLADAAIGIGSATILGGLLGGAVGLISRGERAALTTVFDADRKEWAGEIASPALPAARSAGAA